MPIYFYNVQESRSQSFRGHRGSDLSRNILFLICCLWGVASLVCSVDRVALDTLDWAPHPNLADPINTSNLFITLKGSQDLTQGRVYLV